MKPIVDLEECLSDSPTFRSILKEHEENVDHLDTSVEKLIKLSNNMVEAGKNYSKSQVAFIRGLDELKNNFSKNDAMRNVMERIKSTLTDFVQHENTLNDQIQRAVGSNLSNFMKTEVSRVKETKKHFDKISDELDNNLIRASQVPRSKTSTEFKEVDNLLTATRSCFQHTSLDYVNQISCLQSKKRYEILESVISLLQAFGTFFHQGLDSYIDIEPMLKATGKTLPRMRDETQEIEKQVEKSYTKVTEVVRQPLLIKTKNEVRLEGYLFKRTTNAFKSWNRRWFMIKSHQLVYKKRDNDGENNLTVMEEDLRLCLVRTSYEVDRRFCFEVVSPTKSHILQADSEETCKTWISALAAGIDAAHSDSRSHTDSRSRSHHPRILSSKSSDSLSSNSSSNKSPSNKTSLSGSCEVRNSIRPTSDLLSLSNNFNCCDCRSPDPKWASINLGITLCIECSGIHRSLGVHVSKVRSLTLDDWEPTWIHILTRLGNLNVNSVFEAQIPEDSTLRPVHDSSREVREKWIREKYISKSFVNRSSEDADELLYKMTVERDMVGMIQALSSGGSVNWRNGSEKGSTPLHEAAKGGDTEITEFLLLNGANLNLQDDEGMTSFQRAIEAGQKGQIGLMIKRGADLAIRDSSGRDCVSIALEKSDADIVTLLRLAKLNEEMKNDDLGNPTEELLNDMVRDLSCNKFTSST